VTTVINVLHMRKMTCALVVWSVYIATWTVMTGAGSAMVALWWAAGVLVVGSVRFALPAKPLLQGPGGPAWIEAEPGPAGSPALHAWEEDGGAPS
jgi:hypothetical protein